MHTKFLRNFTTLSLFERAVEGYTPARQSINLGVNNKVYEI